ncbi:MAG: hypothetical protein K0U98_13840 [Deltaproteobacteria bacterium]|nr:hypothetical protein [Deltaproteobacteria bacterium]
MGKVILGVCMGLVLIAGCGGSGSPSGSSGNLLNEAECSALFDKVEEIMASGLSESDREEFIAMRQERGTSEAKLQSCLSGDSWTREGFECAMGASTESQLKDCIGGM